MGTAANGVKVVAVNTSNTASNASWTFGFASTGTFKFPDGSIQLTALTVSTTVPTSSANTGTIGQMAYDTSYVYICVAPDTWKRISASSF
jgi:hypothetical protein